MARVDIEPILRRGDDLADEIAAFVSTDPSSVQFRADLAGLLVVAMAASYESAVKEILIGYSSRHHVQFALFAQSHFAKLNSKINISDLNKYAKTFDPTVHRRFGIKLSARKELISSRIGKDITKSYEQILSWRHDFAHAGIRNTTLEEAKSTHNLAKRVLYAFDEAFA